MLTNANAKEYFPKPTSPKYLVIIITKRRDKTFSNIAVENKKPAFFAIVFADDIETEEIS